jgi:hypothetical protein
LLCTAKHEQDTSSYSQVLLLLYFVLLPFIAADVCGRLQPREATEEELLAVHSPGLVAAVAALLFNCM